MFSMTVSIGRTTVKMAVSGCDSISVQIKLMTSAMGLCITG